MIDTQERISEVYLEDCMIGMARYPDKYFDLACIDPPYGIGQNRNGGKSIGLRKKWARSYEKEKYTQKDWDLNIPADDFFLELLRVSKNQIIWGGNYFELPATKGIIAWDKMCDGTDFSHFELAWSSFDRSARIVRIAIQEESQRRIHPTQKPIKLYDWIYKNYLPQGGKVIDTHLGSGSNRIAANKAGNIDFVGFELDRDYYEAQEKRWKGFISQTRLF